ncbi:hypothetical protein BLX24_02980 [Arsenicibacter rosenii]|uniref:Transporter n=2 Tax=Arsenicibacter rosenii TaxID=1750698 RepID=A0A1S2VRA5_9BACT|nr:hypothetical protein BLX24_02980 [Arsenicibacter rosenii]
MYRTGIRLWVGVAAVLCSAQTLSAQAVRQLTLREVIRQVQEKSPELRAERLNQDLAKADVLTAGLRPNPSLNNQSLQLMQPSHFPEGTNAINRKNRQIWWQLTTPVNVAGQRQKSVALAEETVELNRLNYAETERNLLRSAAQTWLDAWSAYQTVVYTERLQHNLDTLVQISDVRLRNQVITQTDRSRTQLLADQYRLRGRTARQAYQNQLTRLRYLLQTTDSLEVDRMDSLFFRPADWLTDKDVSGLAQDRADVRAAGQAITVAQRNADLQQALRIPRPELGAIYNPQNGVPYLGFYGTMALPFFNKNQGEIRKARIAEDQSRQVAGYTRRQALTEGQVALRNYTTQRDNLTRYAAIRQQGAAVLASVRYAYFRGGTAIVDFLEAQRAMLSIEEEYLATEVAYRQAFIDLLFVTGQIQRIANP